MKKYTLTDEHRAMLPAWRDKWIANGMSTKAMDEADRSICRKAVEDMYRLAGRPKPLVVFCPSPFVLRFASGAAAAIWHRRSAARYSATAAATRDAMYAATDDATYAATYAATAAATDAATYAATYSATAADTDAATRDATAAATDAATDAATHSATRDATHSATRAATAAATDAATYSATRDATDAATAFATRDATAFATRDATAFATRDATDAATAAATDAATRDATAFATRDATDAATRDATAFATRVATDAATRDATAFATRDATDAATADATDAATADATYSATRDATAFATRDATDAATARWWTAKIPKLDKFSWQCSGRIWNCYQGGNFWSGWSSYLAFFRYVAKLPIDYSAFDPWEKLSIHSSLRIVHEKFCMISDRPCVLKVDNQNRPHCEDGPFCAWRDGSALFAVHGVRLPGWIVLRKDLITAEKINSEKNAEVRRIMIGFYGVARYVSEMKQMDADEWGTLYRREFSDESVITVLKVINSTPEPDGSFKDYFLRVNHTLYGGAAGRKARAAVASTWRRKDGSLAFENYLDYDPIYET